MDTVMRSDTRERTRGRRRRTVVLFAAVVAAGLLLGFALASPLPWILAAWWNDTVVPAFLDLYQAGLAICG